MKILTICSSPYVSLEPITALLDKAGLSKELDGGEGYEQLHEKIFTAYEHDSSGLAIKKAIMPGKVWQDMASQLILNNLDQGQWYWSASKAGWLLDFWQDLEPQHRFALIYSPPQLGISECLLNISEKQAELDGLVESWISYHAELLRFYRGNQDKCILVNYEHCLAYPQEFIQVCKDSLSFNFDDEVLLEPNLILNQNEDVEEVLFELVKEEYPEISLLFQELEASATSFYQQDNSVLNNESNDKADYSIAWKDHHYLKKEQAESLEIKELFVQELLERNKGLGAESKLISWLRDQDKEEFGTLSDNDKRETSGSVEKTKALSEKNNELETENELMLLQLHQVQEELEHYFLKYQELESATQSKKSVVFLEQEADESLSIHAQLIQADNEPNGLNINLINLQWQEHSWSQYTLRIVSSDVVHGQVKLSLIRLPVQKNKLLPLRTWPPQTADESGAYWEIDTDLLANEMISSRFYPEDIAFLHALFEQLPSWLKVLEETNNLKNDDWSDYYQIIDDLKVAVDPVYELQNELSE